MPPGRRIPLSLPALGLGLALALLLVPHPGAAQGRDGFLLKEPRVSLAFHLGYAVPDASSEVFDFVRDELTLDEGDFRAPAVGGSLGVRVNPRLDVRLDLGYTASEQASEFRDWVDQDDLPIEQTTAFQRVPLILGLKWYLRDRGRSVGRFAWVPEDWNAFLGAGGGFTWYRFEQEGDFVDFETLDIFPALFVSEGAAPTLQAFAGVDWTLSPNFFLTAEGRYAWADRVDMEGDFVDFEPMDLSGFQASIGLGARF